MKRMTKSENGMFYVKKDHVREIEAGYAGDAIERLAVFEDVYLRLVEQQDEYEAELEKLRAGGKEKSVRFRELLGNKMMNGNTLKLFEIYGLESIE